MEWQGGDWRREAGGGGAWQRSLGTCRPQTMSLVLAFALLLPLLFAQQPEREDSERAGGEKRTERGRGVVANGSRLGYGS